MKERPILFQPPLVGAILRGEKTQTRRVVRDQGHGSRMAIAQALSPVRVDFPLCPYGVVGDMLWVRETWSCTEKKFDPEVSTVRYKADGVDPLPGDSWRPSIHMPRLACRLTLEIVDVRIERLHDISEEDAKAEGVEPGYLGPIDGKPKYTYRMGFFNIWEKINGLESLDADPWVWVINFKL
jgi:hypothetical protein